MALSDYIQSHRAGRQRMLAVLLDPEQDLTESIRYIQASRSIEAESAPDFIFVGGSTGQLTPETVRQLQVETGHPVVLFPGNTRQFVPTADALLFLSLISGRNPELLIGSQVQVARYVRQSGIDTLSVGYILVNGGRLSSVEKASHTAALTDKDEIVDTAIAAQLLGLQSVYLEAGSGAQKPVAADIIEAVRTQLTIPLIVGGGIRTVEQMHAAYQAGADIVVIGNYFEQHPEQIPAFCHARNQR